MSASKSEAALRAKILLVVNEFEAPFGTNQFKKAYKKHYGNFPGGAMSAHDLLRSLPELSFNQEKYKFTLKSENDGYSRDDECVDEMEQGGKKEKNEEDWYDQKEYEKLVASIKKELESNPDPSLGEEDIKLFVKRHLLRRISIGIIEKVKKDSRDGPSFPLSRFTKEWKKIQKEEHLPLAEVGYDTLTAFLKSFPWLLNSGNAAFLIKGEIDLPSSSPKVIIKEEKEASRMLNVSRTEMKLEDEGALRQKVLAVVNEVSKYDEAHKRHFLVDDFMLKWKNTYGHQNIPCTQFGFKKLRHYLDVIPTFYRINKDKYAIGPAKSVSEAAPVKVLNEGKKIESKGLGESKKTYGAGVKDTDESDSDDSDDEEEALMPKDMVQVVRKELTSGEKKVPQQKAQKKAVEARKKAPDVIVICSSSGGDSDSDEGTVQKVVKKAQPRTVAKVAKKQAEKRKPAKRSKSPDVMVLEEDEPSRKVPKLEIQEEKETRFVGEEELNERETSVRGGTRDGETTMGGDGEAQLKCQKEHAPVNQAVMNPSAVAPALGLLMPEGLSPQPFFAPPSMYLPSKGEAAGRYMTYLLDQAEREGLDVDEIAMKAINTITKKIAKKK